MTAKTELYNSVETELINLVCQSPAVLNKLKEVLSASQFAALSRDGQRPAVCDELASERVKNLEISYENDSAILIKTDSKAAIPYDCRQLGFRDNRAKGWKFFVAILESKTHNFNFGAAYSYPDGSHRNRIKNKAYDAGWKLCSDLCKKLTLFFEREYNIPFPVGFKLYEKDPSGPTGERRFKFKIGKSASETLEWNSEFGAQDEAQARRRYAELDEAELRKEIVKLNSDFTQDSMVHNVAPDYIILASSVGRENFSWSDETMQNILQGEAQI